LAVRLLHIADVHLGASCAFLGGGAAQHRARLEAAFERALHTARERQCDLILLAGDLFDSDHPSERLLQQTIRLLAETNLPVCLIPGTHDVSGRRSPYAVGDWKRRCPNVHLLLQAEPGSVPFPELGLAVHGRATPRGESPLRGLSPNDDFKWNVALVHGGLAEALMADEAHPLSRGEIAASGMDYVALGHWHGWRQWSEGSTVACYPGALEPLAFDQKNTGWAALVTLSDSVLVEQVRVGDTRAETTEVRVEGMSDPEELMSALTARADPGLLLAVVLSGLAPEGWSIEVQDILDARRAGFAGLEIVDCAERWAPQEEGPITEGIAPMLRQEALRKMKGASEEEVRVVGEALRLGLAALQGLEVI